MRTLMLLSAALLAAGSRATAQPSPPPPAEDPAAALDCLSQAIAYEAGHEPLEGQQAVAEVVLNRLRDPRFPKTVCGVVFAGSTRRSGCQFTFTCDGSRQRHPPAAATLAAARIVAEDALAGRTPPRVPQATHYHADYVMPYWAPGLVRVTQIGAHIFYHGPGGSAALPGATEPAPGPPRDRPKRDVFAPWGLPAEPILTATP